MPIKVEDAKNYKEYQEGEVKIANFLAKNAGNAFLADEIWKGIGGTIFTPNKKGSYMTWPNFSILVNAIAFQNTLNEMVKKGKIKVGEVAGKNYYFIEEVTVLF